MGSEQCCSVERLSAACRMRCRMPFTIHSGSIPLGEFISSVFGIIRVNVPMMVVMVISKEKFS